MDEAQAPRVKAKSPERPRRAAVLAIAHDGMSDGGELDADLPASPRAERELEKRRVLPISDHPVARDGRFAFGAGRGAGARTLRGEVVPEQAIGGALALPLRGHAEEPRLLVDHHHGGVLVNEAQAAREGDAAARAEDDAVLGPDHDAAVAADAAVELDSPGREPLFEASTGCLREEGAEPRPERGRVTHCGARRAVSCREA